MSLRVQTKLCETCIYRQDSPLNLDVLEAEIADQHMEGHFDGYRICHHSKDAVCAGFWAKHKDDFMMGQVAQRLGFVKLVQDDVL